MNFEIRHARVDDAPGMARLSGELGYPVEVPAMRGRLAVLTTDARHFVAVAEDAAGRLLGWVHSEHRLTVEGGEMVECTGLIVDSAARREGVGRLLMEAAEKWGLERGSGTIRVRSNAARGASHAFYEALGYTRTKIQHVYVKRLPGET